MPELWGRPTWMIDSEPDHEPSWSFWITAGVVISGIIGYAVWRFIR